MIKGVWGLPYKLGVKKVRTKVVAYTVGGDEIFTWKESGSRLLEELVLDDLTGGGGN